MSYAKASAKICKSAICGEVRVPSSKSAAHRELIAAFLAGGRTEFIGNFNVGDIETTAECLKSLGAEITPTECGLELIRRELTCGATLAVNDSGSTLRFLLPLVPALGTKAVFVGTKRLANRPIGGLLETLRSFGAEFSSDRLPLEAGGKLRAGHFFIDGSVSSQYVTGMLLSLPVLCGDSTLSVGGKMVSAPYVEITLETLKKYEIRVERKNNDFYIKGNQKYISPKRTEIEGDWSSACFIAALGALCGKTRILGLNPQSKQGDGAIADILKSVGARVKFDGGALTVERGDLRPIELDVDGTPDIAPVLSAVLAFADGASVLTGVERLRDKESDRLQGIIDLLAAFSVKAETDGHKLVIYGGSPAAGVYRAPDDHRMAMSAAVIAAAANGESVIENVGCIRKSYGGFFDDLKTLGGVLNVSTV